MVQLGVTSPEAQKEQESKKPGGLQETDAPIVLTMTAGPPVARPRPKKTCCSTRTAICITLLAGLVGVAIVGGVLGYMYMHLRRHCIDWGCFGMDEGRWDLYDDIVYPPDSAFYSSDSSEPMAFRELYVGPGADSDGAGGSLAEPRDGHGDRRPGGHGGRRHGGRRGGHRGRDHEDGDRHDGDDHDGGDHGPPPAPPS